MGEAETARERETRAVLRAWRPLIALFLALTLLSAVSLYGLPARTDSFFAWTIDPPLSAAFLGAGYAAGFVLVVLTARERIWARARLAYATVCVFTWATLVATLAHLDRFHFDVAEPWPRFLAWLWTVVYVTVPPWMTWLLIVQRRRRGRDARVEAGLPRPLMVALGGQAVVLSAVGLGLMAAPLRLQGLWPWALTPLTGRTIGAWCVALGFAAGLAMWERDLHRLRAAAGTYLTLGVLQCLALLRFPDDAAWDRPAAWGYVAVLSVMTATGAYGLLARRGDETPVPVADLRGAS